MIATYYAPGQHRLAYGSIPANVRNYCAMRGVDLGSTAIINVNGHRYRLIVRDRTITKTRTIANYNIMSDSEATSIEEVIEALKSVGLEVCEKCGRPL